jgi:farnesyl-diphosphate farnesyltransferase
VRFAHSGETPGTGEVPAPLLAAVSRSFHLSLRFLPAPVRTPLSLAYLLARATDTIADTANAPLALRLESLAAFETALLSDGPDAAASLENLLSGLACEDAAEARLLALSPSLLGFYHTLAIPLRGEIQTVLARIIGGQRGDLLRFGYASEDAPQSLASAADTEAYTYAVAGCVGEFWTRLCALQLPGFARLPLDELLSLGRRFGQGLQLVNILRDLPADLRAGRCYLPADELSAAGLAPAELLRHPERARPVFDRWLRQASEFLSAGERYVRGINGRRLRFSVSLPRRLGEETLALLQRRRPLETPFRLRVHRGTVLRSAFAALLESATPRPAQQAKSPSRGEP